MNQYRLMLGCCLILTFCASAAAYDIQNGKPKTDDIAASSQTVYRWKDADVKIKLKMKESPAEYKLAFYYSPLAAKLNQEQLEQIPVDALGSNPSKREETVKTAPLLD